MPAADQIRTYDFYCRRQLEGDAGLAALADAGQALQAKARPLEPADAPPPDDDDGTEYLLRSRPPDQRVEL